MLENIVEIAYFVKAPLEEAASVLAYMQFQVGRCYVGARTVFQQADDMNFGNPCIFWKKRNSCHVSFSSTEEEALTLTRMVKYFEVYVNSGVPVVVELLY